MSFQSDAVFQICYEICLSDEAPPIYYGILTDKLTGNVEVAVKKLSYNPNKRDQVDREIRALLKIGKCQNIVQYKRHHVSPKSDDLFLAMELCRSGSMAEYKFEGGAAIPFEEKRTILVQLATGIEKIHRTRIIHGGLKLTNVLQSKDGKFIKIGGFGLCKPAEEKTIRNTSNFGVWGSPEHYNKKSRSEKTDIFSAGMIFYHVLSEGQHPFGHEGERKTVPNIQRGKYKLILEKLPYPEVAENLIKRMLQTEKEDRPNAADVLRHPLLWEQSRQKRCIALVKKCWKDLDRVLTKKLHVIIPLHEDENSDQELGDENCLLLYIFLFQKFLDCEGEFKNWADNISNLRYHLQAFNEVSQYSELPELHLIKFTDSNFDATLTELNNNMAEMTIIDNATIDHKLKLLEQPIRQGKLVFEGEFEGVIAEPVVVKLVEQTDENEMAIKVFRDCSGRIDAVVEMKRSIKDFIYPISSASTTKMFCIAMEPCATTLLLEHISQNDIPTSERINLAVHIVSAVLEIHRIGAIHGNIRPEKFLLSKNGFRVKILGSRKMKFSKSLKERSEDLQATAKVLCILMNINVELQYQDLTKFKSLEEANKTSICDDKRLFIDLLKRLWSENGETDNPNPLTHPFFWGPDRKLDFWIAVYNVFEPTKLLQLKEVPYPENWFETLKLTDEERARWFENDEVGTANYKVNKKNATYDKDSSASLLRLIRIFESHLHDIIKEHQKKKNLEGTQFLFNDKKSVGKFFYDRFAGFFCDVYNLVFERYKNEAGLARYFQEITLKQKLELDAHHPSTDEGG